MRAGLGLFLALAAAAALAFNAPNGLSGVNALGFGLYGGSFALMAILLLSSLAHRYRGRLGQGARDAMIWVVALFAIVGGYTFRDALQPFYARIVAELVPGEVIVAGPGVAEVVRRRDGHFVIDMVANGVKLPFVFDTGASTVVLRAEDAAKLGLDVGKLHFGAIVSTANGVARAADVEIATLSVGPITQKRVAALVARPGALNENLLGQNFLNALASYGVEKDKLILRGV